MDTIQIKNSCKRVNQILKEGGQLLDNKIDNKAVMSYYDYLKSINNKENTIYSKLRNVILLEQYLISKSKTFKTFNKEDIYDYFNVCSNLSWNLTTQDRNKLNIRGELEK